MMTSEFTTGESDVARPATDKPLKHQLRQLPKNDESRHQRTTLMLKGTKKFIKASLKLKRAPVWGNPDDQKHLGKIIFKYFKHGDNNTTDPTDLFLVNYNELSHIDSGFLNALITTKDQGHAVVMHGWMDNYDECQYYIAGKPWMETLARDLQIHNNVIVVDWSHLALWSYFEVIDGSLLFVAKTIYTIIKKLSAALNINEREIFPFLFKFKFFAHSMAGHIIAKVAELFHEKYETDKPVFSLIVGMDMAGPFFSPNHKKILSSLYARYRLMHSHAKKVISFHASTSAFPHIGTKDILAHEDYFLNGGLLLDIFPPAIMSHLRVLNVVHKLIQGATPIGYVTLVPNKKYIEVPNIYLPEVTLNLNENLTPESKVKNYNAPIYLSVSKNLEFPTPVMIPAYKRREHFGKDGERWFEINFQKLKIKNQRNITSRISRLFKT